MAVGSARLPAVVGAAAFALAVGLVWAGKFLGPAPALPLPGMQAVGIVAKAVSTLDGTVTAKRRGRVLAASVAPGETVRAGDPLIEFEDLPLFESRAELEREIAELQEGVAKADQTISPPPGQLQASGQELRLAALRHLEKSYGMALREFQRWKTLHEEGLVARVEFERRAAEFAELGQLLEEARATASLARAHEVVPTEDRISPALRRSERLLQRLSRLPDTFMLRSPWGGIVREIHVEEGEEPERGAPLVTLSRAALRRLEADVGKDTVIAAVQSACGVPGPFAFTLRDRVLAMTLPPSEAQLGDNCSVVVLTRQRPE